MRNKKLINRKIGPQCVHVWLKKLSCFDREGHKLKDLVCYYVSIN